MGWTPPEICSVLSGSFHVLQSQGDGAMRRGPRSSDCSFIFLLSDSAGASVVDQDECQKALDNLLNSFQDVMDLQAKVGLIFLVMLCNCAIVQLTKVKTTNSTKPKGFSQVPRCFTKVSQD